MIKIVYRRRGIVHVEDVEGLLGLEGMTLLLAIELAKMKMFNGAEWAHIVNV